MTKQPSVIQEFGFRPWVRRAGLSIVIVAAAVTGAIVLTLFVRPESRYGWIGERFVWVYVGTLWLGGLKIWMGTRRAAALFEEETITLRPLHQLGVRKIEWERISGTEQMIGGDRLVVYYDSPRGMRFVALNLNLIRGRSDFLLLLEGRLRARGFVERVVDRSRYLSPGPEQGRARRV